MESFWDLKECLKRSVSSTGPVNDVYFLENPNLFYDSGHLNREGADLYSKLLATEILNNVGDN